MKTIATVTTQDAQGNTVLSPAEAFPADAIAITCDGTKYTVYQPGDTLPGAN